MQASFPTTHISYRIWENLWFCLIIMFTCVGGENSDHKKMCRLIMDKRCCNCGKSKTVSMFPFHTNECCTLGLRVGQSARSNHGNVNSSSNMFQPIPDRTGNYHVVGWTIFCGQALNKPWKPAMMVQTRLAPTRARSCQVLYNKIYFYHWNNTIGMTYLVSTKGFITNIILLNSFSIENPGSF